MIFICSSSAGTVDANPRAILRERPLFAVFMEGILPRRG